MKQTYHVQIVEDGETITIDPENFTPWLNCNSADEACGLAVNKYLRDAGYMNPRAERPVINLDVYHFPASVERHPNGRPICVSVFKMRCTPTK